MATERFDHPAFARIGSISDELSSINALILAHVNQLPNKPQLVDQLIHRCDELLRELHALKAANRAPMSGRHENSESPTNGSGVTA